MDLRLNARSKKKHQLFSLSGVRFGSQVIQISGGKSEELV